MTKEEEFKPKGRWAFILGYILLIIAIVAFVPIASIWALNTLFPVLEIPYTFWTWLAFTALVAVAILKNLIIATPRVNVVVSDGRKKD